MRNWKLSIGIAAVGVTGFVAGVSLPRGGGALAAQPTKDTQPKKEAQPGKGNMEAMMKAPLPGPEHKVLEVFVGEFEGPVKMWMTPGGPPMESRGTITREWAMDGLFVTEHIEGDSMGGEGAKPFKGMGAMGYNTIEKKYESAWIENMATQISTANGTYDAKSKTFTFSGDCYDPMTMKKVRSRSMIDVSNPDKEIMTGYTLGPDGKEFKSFEGTFSRRNK